MIVKKYDIPKDHLTPDASDEVDQRARKYMKANDGATYSQAVREVLKADRKLAEAYVPPRVELPEDTAGCLVAKNYSEAHQSLDEQATDMAAELGIPYSLAFKRVITLSKNRLLFKSYVAGSPKRSFESD